MDDGTRESELSQLASKSQDTRAATQTADQECPRSYLSLLCRNAQLEVELRHAKEQLAQANQSTQYLLQLLSCSSSNHRDVSDSVVRPERPYGLAKSVDRKDSVADVPEVKSESTPETPLVSFEEDCQSLLDLTEPEALPASPASVGHVQPSERPLVDDSLALGISQSSFPNNSFPPTTEPGAPLPSFSQPSHRQQHGFSIRQSGGTSLFIPTPPLGDSPASSFSRNYPSPAPFLDHEHRSLAGKAFVWVDMAADELSDVIARYAVERPRHTAEEYRSYFEDHIRPAYLKQEEERKQVRAAAIAAQKSAQVESVLIQPLAEESQSTQSRTQESRAMGEVSPPMGRVAAPDPVAETTANHAEVDDTLMATGGQPDLRLSQHMHVDDTCITALSKVPAAAELDTSTTWADTDGGTIPPGSVKNLRNSAPVSGVAAAAPTLRSETSALVYEPPNLHKPEAVDEARALQAEFVEAGSYRGRDRGGIAAAQARHDSKDPSYQHRGGRLPINGAPYIASPQDISDLFAKAAEGERNPRRTVIITGIAPSTTLHEVLETVRGGPIFSSLLLETCGMRTEPALSTNTALITFVNGRHAQRFASHHNQQQARPTTAQLVPTITRPLPAHLLPCIQQSSLSRILSIHDPKSLWTPPEILLHFSRHAVRSPLKAERDADVPALMLFHFASMLEAKTAWNVMGRDSHSFGRVERGFSADPCGSWPARREGDGAEAEDDEVGEEDGVWGGSREE